jgi:tetratricopeptide (TPR) repeat protein
VIQERLNNRNELGVVLDKLGIVKSRQGHYEDAAKSFERALNVVAPLGDQLAICTIFNNLGVLAQTHGDAKLARIYFEESLTLSRALGDLDGIGILLNNIGEVHDDLDEARRYFEESHEIFNRTLQIIINCVLGPVNTPAKESPDKIKSFCRRTDRFPVHAIERIIVAIHKIVSQYICYTGHEHPE